VARMNAEVVKANAVAALNFVDTYGMGASYDYLEMSQFLLGAIAVLEKIAEAEIPPHGSPDSWAINMARDFIDGKVSE